MCLLNCTISRIFLVFLFSLCVAGCIDGSSSSPTEPLRPNNTAPIANAGSSQSVSVGSPVNLSGLSSSDAENDNLTFAWTLVSKPSNSSATLSSSTSATPRFIADAAGAYIVKLVVSDGTLSSAEVGVTITATALVANNTAPIANAGKPQNVMVLTNVKLDGTASSDANADPLTYQWTLIATPAASTATLAQPSSATPMFYADRAGTYVVSLVVNDGKVSSSATTTTVNVYAEPQNTNRVRLVYAIPKDRVFRQDWSDAVGDAMLNIQLWTLLQMNGKTFALYSRVPEVCHLQSNSANYLSNTWNKVAAELQICFSDFDSNPSTNWVVYADVLHDVNAAGRLGAGRLGLTMMPRQDLEGLGGQKCVVTDEGSNYCATQLRWVGGLGHELGHSFGLPHPPGCDLGLASCDSNALMWAGYADYPNTYWREDDKASLLMSKFFR